MKNARQKISEINQPSQWAFQPEGEDAYGIGQHNFLFPNISSETALQVSEMKTWPIIDPN